MATAKPCIACGAPSRNGTRCPACQDVRDRRKWAAQDARRPSSWARGYDGRHRSLREQVLARDSYICWMCGGPATQADHVVPLVAGGVTSLQNLRAICGPCNARKGGRT